MKKRELPDQNTLKSLLDYDPLSGKLFWKYRDKSYFAREADMLTWNTRFGGKEAFTAQDDKGYYRGSLLSKNYLAHRIIFKYIHGYDPDQIDHRDQNPSNNSELNLIDASAITNSQNSKLYSTNSSGTTGVTWDKSRNKWLVSITLNYRHKYIGRFENLEDAVSARKAAELQYGFSPNHGN